MRFPRRRFLELGAGAAALAVVSRTARADTYPTRPVHVLVGYAAGGVNDIIARLTGEWLSLRLSQPFIIEDRPGAGSNVATEAVVRSSPDGYTLLQASSSNGFNASLYDNLKFDFIRDIAPVASTVRTFSVMLVTPSFRARSVPEFIAYAKANPGKINMGSAGPGSSPHLAGELFKAMTGVDLVTVHFRGDGPAIPELIAGRIQVMFGSVVTWIEQIKSGQVRALAVTSTTRAAIMPDVPSVGDFVPGYEATGWQGIGAPSQTPTEIIEKLNEEINAGLVDPSLKTRFAELGVEPFANSPIEFRAFIVDYIAKWAKVIRSANIKAE